MKLAAKHHSPKLAMKLLPKQATKLPSKHASKLATKPATKPPAKQAQKLATKPTMKLATKPVRTLPKAGKGKENSQATHQCSTRQAPPTANTFGHGGFSLLLLLDFGSKDAIQSESAAFVEPVVVPRAKRAQRFFQGHDEPVIFDAIS